MKLFDSVAEKDPQRRKTGCVRAGERIVKFWRLLVQGRFRQAWEILSRRPDSEHEQALVRIVLASFASVYLFWSMYRDGLLDVQEIRLLWMCGLYASFSVGLFILITIDPKVSPVRRCSGDRW